MVRLKHFLALTLAATMLFSLCACGEETVEIKVSAAFFEDGELTDENLQNSVEKNGFESYTINDDGSVTYVMTKSAQAKMLDGYKQIVEETNAGLIEGENSFESFERIEYKDDLTQFDVYVNEEYGLFDSLSCMVFYMLGGMYQSFSGIPAEQIQVVVNYIDVATGEVIESADYQKWISGSSDDESDTDKSGDTAEDNVEVEPVTSEPAPAPSESVVVEVPADTGLNMSDLVDMVNSNIDYVTAAYPELALTQEGTAYKGSCKFNGEESTFAAMCNDSDIVIYVIVKLIGSDPATSFAENQTALELKYGAPSTQTHGVDAVATAISNSEDVVCAWDSDLYIEHSVVFGNEANHLLGVMTQEALDLMA